MNDAGMIGVLFPQLFQQCGGLELFGQSRVVRRRIANAEHRKGVQGLHLEIVGIFVAKLMHRIFVGHHPITRSNRSVTRLSHRPRGRTLGRIVINI